MNYAVKNYWPSLHFILDGYDYKWTPERYVFNITSKNVIGACMGFDTYYIRPGKFGSNWIIGHDILFDRENNLLGFAEANCTINKKINMSNGQEIFEEKNKNTIKETIKESIEETIAEKNEEKVVENIEKKIEEKIEIYSSNYYCYIFNSFNDYIYFYNYFQK